ncbi:MAG: bifunctional nuclease family protein [Deltaproteobacteria bacterium]|nr:MAG: bifunctional nuclease family protein [Deltaproteobacteria bacterium]
MTHPRLGIRIENGGSSAVYKRARRLAMGARGLVVLVGMLCLGAGAPDPVEMEVGGVLPMRGGGAAVALIDATRSKALPIAVSGTEALSIQLRLAKQHYPRPLTHDLMESIVRELGGKIVRVQIDEIRGEAFIASVFVQVGQRTSRIDARPSDGIALALGNALPVFVARKVLDRAGMSPDALENPESAPTPSRRGPI